MNASYTFASRIRRPTIAGRKPRTIVSTSGNSGIQQPPIRERIAFSSSYPARPTIASSQKSARSSKFGQDFLKILDKSRSILKDQARLCGNSVDRAIMLAETRRRLLVDMMARWGFATLDELVKLLGVSESTVRRDLEILELAGSLKRTHGGAVYSEEGRTMPALEDRVSSAAIEKQAIGKTTAALIEDGDSILLDGGTTTLEVARSLIGRRVQVVTNSLPIAQLLAAGKNTDLILIGGYVYPRTGVALGPLAIATMEGLRVRKAILGAGGVMAEGIYNSNLLLVETERRMMSCGQEVVIVADHSKFGRLALARLCGLDEVHQFVTDSGASPEHQAMLAEAGLRVHLAPCESSNGVAASTAPSTGNLEGK
jgi:DeoR/GlpR family transcriptional regulator of sugar metabolism